MKIFAVTQARSGSSRLPGKVLKELVNGQTMLQLHAERVNKSKLIDKFIIATTNEESDNAIAAFADNYKYSYSRGSENDVLDRYYQAVKNDTPDYVVRVTSDCPLIDPELIDKVIKSCIENKADYCANILEESFPDGQDIEVFTFSALKNAWENATLKSDREHVTPYIRKHDDIFNLHSYSENSAYKNIRMTVDEPADFDMMNEVINELGINKTWRQYAEHINKNRLKFANQKVVRNEGYLKSLKKDQDNE